MDSAKTPKINKEEFNVDLKSLEVQIEKYPMAESKNMFESFFIIGYDDLYYQEKIIKKTSMLINDKKEELNSKEKKNSEKIFSKFYCRNLPTILSSITSDFTGPILNGNQIIENVFPIPPAILYDFEGKEIPNEKKNNFVIFSNIQNEVVNYGYGHIFYEKKNYKDIVLYIPKAFVIISQYPFFRIFNQLCEEILELFNKNQQQLQIPIEIQIYNIINFVPASINTGLKMTLIPREELNQINYIKNQDDFFNSSIQKKYYPAQLNGYRATEINFCYLLNVIPVDLILEIYMNLICGRIIGVFLKMVSELSVILHIFHQFLFPFAPNENVACLPPIKFFCNDIVDQNIVGFLCDYDDLEKFDPFREVEEGEFRCLTDEEEKIQLDPLYFRCDYILDLNKKVFKEPDKYSTGDDNTKENKQLNNYIKKLFGKKKAESEFEYIFLELYKNLEENINKLTMVKKLNNKNKNMFLPFVNEETKFLNKLIIKSFYQFNLKLADLYYQNISQYKWDYNKTKEEQINVPIKSQKECQLNPDEYLFFSCFANSLFCNCLDNFVGGYSNREPKIYKAPKLIFDNLLYFLKIKKKYKFDDRKISDILVIYDEIYTNKIKSIEKENNEINLDKNKNNIIDTSIQLAFYEEEEKKNKEIININHKTFTFFEFYKYYISSPDTALYFYNISNPEFVSGKIIKIHNRVKYIYKYKKIALDQNIIFKYIYKLKQMDEKTREKCFTKIITEEINKKEKIRSYENFISSALEKYYIENKYIDNIELINFSILGIAILTVSKHKLIYFTEEINCIIKNLTFLTRKFAQIILSVSLRVFAKEEVKNFFVYEKYFDIYKTAIVDKYIFPNDELIKIQKKISQFKDLFKERKEINLSIEKKDYNYKLDYNKKIVKKFNLLELYQDFEEDESKKNNLEKLDIKFDFNKKKFRYPSIYVIQKLYENICNLINDYYQDLDYNIILNKKDEFNKLIIYLLFYITIIKEKAKEKEKEKDKDKKEKKIHKEEVKRDFPENIELFLIACLEH